MTNNSAIQYALANTDISDLRYRRDNTVPLVVRVNGTIEKNYEIAATIAEAALWAHKIITFHQIGGHLDVEIGGEVLTEALGNREKLSLLLGIERQFEKLQQQTDEIISLIQQGNIYITEEIGGKIGNSEIDIMLDFIKWYKRGFKQNKGTSSWEGKPAMLKLLNRIFEIGEFPEDYRIDGGIIFNYPTRTKEGTPNDHLKKRLTAKPLKDFEGESIRELQGDSRNDLFYTFVIMCFFAGVKLKP